MFLSNKLASICFAVFRFWATFSEGLYFPEKKKKLVICLFNTIGFTYKQSHNDNNFFFQFVERYFKCNTLFQLNKFGFFCWKICTSCFCLCAL